jgi:hypothetical protein
MQRFPLLFYEELQAEQVQKKFEKVMAFLREGNFRSAETKKMAGFPGIYRAKLDAENRLLFKFVRYGGETYLLLLDIVLNHAYEKSRFLRGAEVDESRLPDLVQLGQVPDNEVEDLRYLDVRKPTLHFLNKAISFDEAQRSAFEAQLPLIVIGSAGSGKTALTLEKMKLLTGNVAYVTLSGYLADNAQELYFANGYRNEQQEVDFLSFGQFLMGLRIPEGREVTFPDFEQLFARHRQAIKLREPYKLFEEFKGVLTGSHPEKPFLSLEDYLSLGIRQSIFPLEEREEVYRFFEKYLVFLREEGLYDTNILAQSYRPLVSPVYDFVVIDEVQDMTNVQLALVLKSLKKSHRFLLCGDANQIVHPNFFSWAGLKTMFYASGELGADIVRVLHTNYRNTIEVTELSNRILKLKNARFGSIDRESTYLIRPVSGVPGTVEFLEDQEKLKQELNQQTRRSTRFAVVVPRPEDKAEARRFFDTPLVFSVQEAKGLEYDNVILFNFISSFSREFRHIALGVSPEELEAEIQYSRARDKSDRELDSYKFYINALYVAITRSVSNLYVIEKETKHPLLLLLGLVKTKDRATARADRSSDQEWREEALRLARQGKREQSEAIRKLLEEQRRKNRLSEAELADLRDQALNPELFNNQAKKKLFQYVSQHNDFDTIRQLADLRFSEAKKYLDGLDKEIEAYFRDCRQNRLGPEHPGFKKFGPHFRDAKNQTPLMQAVQWPPAFDSVDFLLKNEASRILPDGRDILAYTLDLYLKNQEMHWIGADGAVTSQMMAESSALSRLYLRLELPSITFSANGRLFKVNSQSMEYLLVLLLQHAFGTVRNIVLEMGGDELLDDPVNKHYAQGLQNQDFHFVFQHIPSAIAPDYRRKPAYLNQMLAKHEANSNHPNGKGLFVRLDKGFYAPNPELKIHWSGHRETD